MTISTLVIIGTTGCGKSCLCIRFIVDRFITSYELTLEDLYRKQVEVDGEVSVMDIFDTAGLNEFHLLRDGYIRQGNGFIFVYALDYKNSFLEVQKQFDHVMRIKDSDEPVPCVLVATKSDLEDRREVTMEEGRQLAQVIGASFFEVSSLTGKNVTEVFHQMIREVRKRESAVANVKETKKKDKSCILL